ncbi:MAG: HD domain-containing protein [Lachnospiraceae bacterium]|nr:HD domain-containing protein [Lachnospiraceae bacterium]
MEPKESVNIVLKYIDAHLEETFTTKELARVAGYSEYHFIRMFKSYMSTTIMEYVCKRKLIKASEDILAGKKIIDVALKYDWQSHSGFTRAFQKEFGFSPSLLRAMKISIERLGGNAMSHVFLEATKTGLKKEELLEILKERLETNGISIAQDILLKVYECACDAYKGIQRYSGEEYVTHTLNTAILLAELGAESKVVLAGMLCDVAEKGVVSLESLEKELPKEVYDIVAEAQNVKKELSRASDEVILIKLAERLHNMRTIEFIHEEKRRAKAIETIELFMPFARQLGNKKLMDELNDLGMKYYAE